MRRFSVLLLAWLFCPAPGRAAPVARTAAQAKAKFEAAGKRAASLRAGFGKLRGAPLTRVARWSKAAEKTAVSIVQVYDRLARSGAQPFAARAVCAAGQLQSGLAEAVYTAWMQAATPAVVKGLGPTAMVIFRQKLHEAAEDLAAVLDKRARAYHQHCLRSAACAPYFPEAKRLLRRPPQRRASYAATVAPVATSRPGVRPRPQRTQTWWYTRCRALEIVTKAQAPSAAECISLVVAELRRLVRRGERLGRQRQWRAAIRAYTRALLLDPDWAPARRGRALAHASLGSRKGAAVDLVWWRSQRPGTPAAAQLAAEVARRLKKRRR